MIDFSSYRKSIEKVGFLDHKSTRLTDIFFLLLLCTLVCLPGIGLRDPWPADEPRFTLVAKQMVDSGQWFFPTRGNEYYADKPPVFMWLIALFYFLTGNITLVFLIPSALAATGCVLLIYDLGRRLWDRKTGIASAVSLLAMVQFVIQAKAAQIDMVLTFWTTLAVYGLIRHLLLSSAPGWFLVGSFSMGLGIITKGVGFIPLMIFVPYLLALYFKMKPMNGNASKAFLFLSPVFMLLGVLLWFLPMLYLVNQSGDPNLLAYKNDILYKQTADRYLKSWHHIKPFWYFIVNVIPWAWLPFSFLIPKYAGIWWRKMRQLDSRIFVLLGWSLCVLLFFSLTKGKRGVYILPLTPVFALLVGAVQVEVFQSQWVQRYFKLLTVLFGVIITTIGLTIQFAPEKFLQQKGVELPGWFAIVSIAVGLGIALSPLTKLKRGNHLLFASVLTIWIYLGAAVWPAFNHMRSPRQMMSEIRKLTGAETPLAMVSWKEQLLLQDHGPVVTFGFKKNHQDQMAEAIKWLEEAAPDEKRWLLINGNEGLSAFKSENALYHRKLHRRDWYLFSGLPLAE